MILIMILFLKLTKNTCTKSIWQFTFLSPPRWPKSWCKPHVCELWSLNPEPNKYYTALQMVCHCFSIYAIFWVWFFS